MYVAKIKALIKQLDLCHSFCLCKKQFSHDVAQINEGLKKLISVEKLTIY